VLSIIIPTLNEEKYLADCLKSLPFDQCEVIVIDGGSTDNTVTIAENFGVQVMKLNISNRAVQMNTGAKLAKGDTLLFFHADSRLPKKGVEAIITRMDNCPIIGGGFSLDFFPFHPFYALLAASSNIFCRMTQMIFGDRGIFIRSFDFWRLGGFPEIDIMEDAALSTAMRQSGKIVILPDTVMTSARKYANETKIQAIYRTMWAYVAYRIGVPAKKIKDGYYGLTPKK